MNEKKQYWPSVTLDYAGKPYMTHPAIELEARSQIALKLMEHFGVIAGKADGEDAAGRAKMSLQSADELVTRCFAMADAFLDRAEQRNEVRSATETLETAALAETARRDAKKEKQ